MVVVGGFLRGGWRVAGPLGGGNPCRTTSSLAGLVDKQRLADVCDLGDGAFEIERLGEHNLENLRDNGQLQAGRWTGKRADGTDECGGPTFWTLMLWLVLLKISAARIALAKSRAFFFFFFF